MTKMFGTGGRLVPPADDEPVVLDEATGLLSAGATTPPYAGVLREPEPPSGIGSRPEPEPTPKKRRAAPNQQLVSTLLELLGIGLLAAGCFILAVWAGFMVLGLCLTILGVAIGMPPGGE